MFADLFDQSAVSLSKSRREKKQKCTGLGNNSAETHEPINRGPRWTNMSITVKVQAWISGNHSNCVLILKPCSFLTNFSIAHVSLTCYELRFALYWGKITFAPPHPHRQPLHWTVIYNIRAHFHPITTHQRFTFPTLWLRETQAIKSLQCSLSATCNLKPISDLTHHEHEEIAPRRSKCQFLSESNIANGSVITIIFHTLIEWLWTDSIRSCYDLRSWKLLRRWEFSFHFFLKSLTKGLFDPSEGDRKFKS